MERPGRGIGICSGAFAAALAQGGVGYLPVPARIPSAVHGFNVRMLHAGDFLMLSVCC